MQTREFGLACLSYISLKIAITLGNVILITGTVRLK